MHMSNPALRNNVEGIQCTPCCVLDESGGEGHETDPSLIDTEFGEAWNTSSNISLFHCVHNCIWNMHFESCAINRFSAKEELTGTK